MVQFSAKLKSTDVLTRSMNRRLRTLRQAELAARISAAKTATAVTRDTYHYVRPADVPKRTNRPTLQGKFRTALLWTARKGDYGQVFFDVARANRMTGGTSTGTGGYWIILEIGTGQSATIKHGGAANPRGRPVADANYIRTVKSQDGRRISQNLGWARGLGGAFEWPTPGARGGQLYLKRHLSNVPFGPVTAGITAGGRTASSDMVIRKEIDAQHFVRKGGTVAFREYRTTVLAAARSAFAGKSKP